VDTRGIRTPSAEVPAEQDRLEDLEERYRHELMDQDERQELRERILRLRRRLGL
jgi:polyhydroxyalkanoate synthesis regulator phasin